MKNKNLENLKNHQKIKENDEYEKLLSTMRVWQEIKVRKVLLNKNNYSANEFYVAKLIAKERYSFNDLIDRKDIFTDKESYLIYNIHKLIKNKVSFSNINQNLIEKGYAITSRKYIISEAKKDFNEEQIFKILNNNKSKENDQLNQEEKKEDNESYVPILLVLIGSTIPIFKIESMYIQLTIILIGGILGYIGFKKSRIASALSSILYILLLDFSVTVYFQNNINFLEDIPILGDFATLIPIILPAIPAYIIFLLLNFVIEKFKHFIG